MPTTKHHDSTMSRTNGAVGVASKIPVLLLKTKSTPHDGYEEYFAASEQFSPQFVPVLEHSYNAKNLQKLKTLLTNSKYENDDKNYGVLQDSDTRYGGIIFTSQRAVEAFTQVVQEVGSSTTFPHQPAFHPPSQTLPLCRSATHTHTHTHTHIQSDQSPPTAHPLTDLSLPLYVVGPATSRALTSLRNTHLPTCTIHGALTGNGENLATFILTHYNSLHPPPPPQTTTSPDQGQDSQDDVNPNNPKRKPRLLFLVGEQRRDIIPKTLTSPTLPPETRIGVDEMVIYETGVMSTFPSAFTAVVAENSSTPLLWVVVFSPTGCEAMLRALGFLSDTPHTERGRDCEKVGKGEGRTRKGVFVATIGPTTREFLGREFGFEVDVCAEMPSPEGVGKGMRRFMEDNRLPGGGRS